MKNILNETDRNNIIDRINNLKESDKRLWGKMTINGMICHVADQIRMATGKLETKYVGNFILKTLLKKLVLLGMPSPKGKIMTVKELDQDKGGTQPTGFEQDKKTLIELIENFEKEFSSDSKYRHPAFGLMSKNQWSRLVYIHLDHHLNQFGR